MADWITPAWLAMGCFVFVAYTLEAITGFGSTVIALSLGAMLLPIPEVLAVLVPLNVVMASTMVWRYRTLVDVDLLLRVILPGMVLGTAVGYGLSPRLDGALLKQAFGVFIFWFAARELWRMRHPTPVQPRPAWLVRLITLGAGLCQGVFAAGGPLLVFGLAGQALDKSRFRATLAAVWLCLNTLLACAYLWDGRLLGALPKVAFALPLLFAGVWVGERLHHRVSELQFRKAIFALLLLTSVLLVWPR